MHHQVNLTPKYILQPFRIPIEIISNEFKEIADNTYHRIIFQKNGVAH